MYYNKLTINYIYYKKCSLILAVIIHNKSKCIFEYMNIDYFKILRYVKAT